MMGPLWFRRAARFARAVDPGPGAEGSGGAARDGLDQETRHLVDLAERLRTTDFGGEPAPEFRDRLRAQLVTLARTQLPAGAVPEPRHGDARRATGSGRRGAGRSPRPPRPSGPARWAYPRLTLAAAALSALVACAGLVVVVSGHALPGDTLYALKRTTEGVELALARGDQAKATRRLDFAQTRARELSDLVVPPASGSGADQVSPRSARPATGDTGARADPALVTATLRDMDQDTRAGTRGLTESAVASRSDAALADLSSWAADQRAILEPVLEQLHGDSALRAERSAALLDRIADRVTALRRVLTCSCLDRGLHDDLGPLPCWPCVPDNAGREQQAGTVPPLTRIDRTGQSTATAAVPTGTGPSTAGVGSPSTGGGPGSTGATGGTGLPGLPGTTESPPLLPSVSPEPTGGGGLLPPILPTGVLPPLLPGLLPGLLGG